MADRDLIEDYLRDLRHRVARWHRRPDDVVAEAADHLRQRVEVLVAAGSSPEEAAREALALYGTAGEVADAHLRAAVRPAMPTEASRTAGALAMTAATGWVVLPVATAVVPDDVPLAWFALASVFHAVAALSLAACWGLWARHGGLGVLGWVAAVPAALALPFVLFVWPIPAWLLLLGVAAASFGCAMLRRRLAPSVPTLGMTCGLGIAATAVVAAELVVEGGDDFAFLASGPAIGGVVVGVVVFGAGLFGVGRWLRSETPMRVPPLPVPAGR
jgi:hypothetical protein